MKFRSDIAHEEATQNPIFLLQSREIIVINIDRYKYDSDLEALVDDDGNEIENQELLDRKDATVRWRTESIWLTRKEAEAYGKRTAYHYPDGWRVYCINAMGELASLLSNYAGRGYALTTRKIGFRIF